MGTTPVKQRRLSDEAALSYVESRHPNHYRRAEAEEQIVRRWLKLLPEHSVILDCPCGVGRFVNTVLYMRMRYVGADYSPAMIRQAEKVAAPSQVFGFLAADAERLPVRDDSVDCVLLWRLLHHIPDPETRKRMLREAGRVTRNMVLVSFHHPISFTFLRRSAQRLFTRDWRIADITHWRLAREARECGLELVETKSFGKFRSINWFARLRKRV